MGWAVTPMRAVEHIPRQPVRSPRKGNVRIRARALAHSRELSSTPTPRWGRGPAPMAEADQRRWRSQ
ncbi:hypothetical protein ACFPRL_09145 [Pseudoclavibacter helvolus]